MNGTTGAEVPACFAGADPLVIPAAQSVAPGQCGIPLTLNQPGALTTLV